MRRDIRRSFKDGSLIVREGETGDCAYIIEDGAVEISISRGGEKVVLAQRGVGEIFGEMAIVDDQPRSASVTALGECRLLILSRTQLQARLRTLDPVLRMVFGVVLERFRDSLRDMRGGSAPLADEAVGADPPEAECEAPCGSPDPRHSVFRQVIERIELEQELVQALHDDVLRLHLQPLVCSDTCRIKGFEALARWPHPERGMIPPGIFIAMAEEAGLMPELTKWAVRSVCEILASMPPEAAPYISVNVTANDISEPSFYDFVSQTLTETGVGPERLVLEITESSLIEQPESAVAMMERFGDLGIAASIDDFGAGYSNFSYLARYPVRTVKIDKSMVDDVVEDERQAMLVRGIVMLAESLGMTTVAEGIEDERQALRLRELGCHIFQGYFFSKPQPVEDWTFGRRAEVEARRRFLGDEEDAVA